MCYEIGDGSKSRINVDPLTPYSTFTWVQRDGEGVGDEDHDYSALPNLLQLSFYLEQSGIGLSREQMIRIWLALRTLVESQPIERVRFWGTVLGTERNYIVAEVQWREGEGDDDELEVCGSEKSIFRKFDLTFDAFVSVRIMRTS